MTPAALIAQARLAAEPYTPDTCAIQTLVKTEDNRGGFIESWVTIETVAGLVQAVDDTEAIVGGATRGAVTHKLMLKVTPITQVIDPSQRIVVAARDGAPEMIFTQPKRLDQSYRILVRVAAVIDVSNTE